MITEKINCIKVFQIYYHESQLKEILPEFTPYFNKNTSIFLESGVICDLIKNQQSKQCDYFGIFSWKIKNKINNFCYSNLVENVNGDSSYDIIAPNPKNYKLLGIQEPHRIQRRLNTGGRKSVSDFSMQDAFRYLLDCLIQNKIVKKHNRRFLKNKRNVIYFNAFVAKQSVYEDYVKTLLVPTIDLINSDRNLYNKMTEYAPNYDDPPIEFTRQTGFKKFPNAPFILERLINLYIDNNTNLKIGWVL